MGTKRESDNGQTMISSTTYCVRACSDPLYCPTTYDEMGCYFLTSNGIGWDGVYQDCVGDDGDPPGVYVDAGGGKTVTYTQGEGEAPAFSIPAVRGCTGGGSVSMETAINTTGGTVMTSASAAQSDSASSRARTVEGGTQQVGMTQMASAARGSSNSTSTSGGSHRGEPAALGLVIAVTAWIAVT